MNEVKKQIIIKDKRMASGGAKSFFSKLSRGLMLPIALLPIAGMFLGIGAGFENVISRAMKGHSSTSIHQAQLIFTIMKDIGNVVFANLPVLFALGVAVAFSEDAGVAVFSTLVGYVVFNATQSTMIWSVGGGSKLYNILWYRNVEPSVVGSNLGITSLQTSVFGGITIGLFVAWLYNKYHTFQMPKVLGFFSGTRFVPIITFILTPLIGLFFLMIWPLAGVGLSKMGSGFASMPGGIDSFLFGVIERSLIPFGLHHAFYAPLWYTSVGGNFCNYDSGHIGQVLASGNQTIWFKFQELNIPFNILDHLGKTIDGWKAVHSGDWINISHNEQILYTLTNGMNPGSYMQGKFPIMMFALPAAGAAMIMAAKKEKREVAMSVIGAAALTAFLTGITEPLEFTFLFLAPVLYYGFHVWMAGLSFLFMDILGAHMGMTFSGGIFDFALFGILPDATGLHANCYWAVVIGVVFMPIYYGVFSWYIRHFNIKTPGREDSDSIEVKLVSKADYKASKEAKKGGTKSSSTKLKNDDRATRVALLEKNLGGLDNLVNIDACITRLRLTVADRSKVNDEGLKAMGAVGIVGKTKSIQVIFGAEADRFKVELKKLQKERE